MTIGVLREFAPETRVSLTDEALAALTKKGHEVWVERGAGNNAFCADEAFVVAGAKMADRAAVIEASTEIGRAHV